MRIALVSSGYAPMVGGLEKVARELACAWKRAGHEVRVITNRSLRKLPSYEEIDGISVSRYYFVWEFPKLGFVSILKFFIQCLLLPWTLWYLWKELDPRKTDIASVHYVGPPAWWAVLIAKKRLLPITVTLHGSDLLIEPRRSCLKRVMLRKILSIADGITTVSHFMLNEMEQFFPELRGKGKVISNGFDPSELEGVQGISRERPYGLCVARLSRQKGHGLLIDAFETLGPSEPGFDLVFLGNGPAAQAIIKKAKDSPLHDYLSFRGSLPHSEVLSWMKAASFIVIPSEAEPFGLVALEARALSRPIVALKKGALPEVLEGYSGVTWVQGETSTALAQGITQALRTETIARETALPFPRWPDVAEKYLNLFRKYVRNRN